MRSQNARATVVQPPAGSDSRDAPIGRRGAGGGGGGQRSTSRSCQNTERSGEERHLAGLQGWPTPGVAGVVQKASCTDTIHACCKSMERPPTNDAGHGTHHSMGCRRRAVLSGMSATLRKCSRRFEPCPLWLENCRLIPLGLIP